MTEFQIFMAMRKLYSERNYAGEAIAVRRDFPLISDLQRAVQKLQSNSVIKIDSDFTSCYRIIDLPDQSPEAICCSIDPYCYISHLSAMQWHGLSERNPLELTLTTPSRPLWSTLSSAKMEEIYEGEGFDQVVLMHRVQFPEKVRRRPVRRHETRHPGSWRQVPGQVERVSSVGQTFLDMITEPSWCGGMAHVVEIWEREAEIYLDEIVSAVERSPKKLAKVRAGYLLQERFGLSDPRIDSWRQFAQRGGSQRLDPEGPYVPPYSEAWMISVNI